MIDLTFTNGQKIQIDGRDVVRTVTQTVEKLFTFEQRDMGQPFVEKIQRPQSELFYGAST